ncbi:MAG: hypothetical protein F4X98_06200 [Gammaproteobacteria bacterium]|nr:hypothetical protein [Gammaproteobacteria bacterium]
MGRPHTTTRRSCLAAFVLLTILLPGTTSCGQAPGTLADADPEYVGSATCATCHEAEYQAWGDSHHRHAMALPDPMSVAGDFATEVASGVQSPTAFLRSGDRFVVRTTGPEGTTADFDVAYVFGTAPLQQVLLPLSGGRLQAFGLAWDTHRRHWFHLQNSALPPDDVLHWTQPSHNWNLMCADCHSTAVVKGYDRATRSYRTTFTEVSVGCEACHGPGSVHVESDGQQLPVGFPEHRQGEINACAPCHSRRAQLAEGFKPHRPFLDHYSPALLEDGLYFADGQIEDEVYVYGSFLQSRMHAAGVTCSDCHEPHSAGIRAEGNALCVACHNPIGREDFPTLPLGEFDHPDHHLHKPGEAGSFCVDCHMPARTYMVVDDRRDHGFRIPRPDLAAAIEAPNACTGCHLDQSSTWAADVLQDAFGPAGDHFAPAFADGRRGLTDAAPGLVAVAENRGHPPGAENRGHPPGEAKGHPPIIRATALSLLRSYADESVQQAVVAGLGDPSPLVRIGALRGLADWPPESRWRWAGHLLRDPLLAVRVEAVPILAPLLETLPVEGRMTLQASIAEYLDVQAFNDDRPESHTNRAGIHLAMGETVEAETAFREALALQPAWIPGLVNLADLYRATNRDTEGGELLARAARIAPESADVLSAYGLWMVRQDRRAEALRLFYRAANAPTATWRHAYVHAVALHSAGRPEEALDALDRGIDANPRDPQLLQTALGIARELGDSDRVESYRRRIQSLSAP